MVKQGSHPGAVKNKNGPHPGALENKNGSQPGAVKKVTRRVEQARASYARAEGRVAALRLRLTRAEEKLTRRAARLSAAEESLAALAAAPGLDASAPPEEANAVAAVVVQADQADPTTSGLVADTLMAPAAHETSSPEGVTTPADAATEPAATAQSATHGAGARPARSRRKPASQGE